jgi:hypothetical protein
VANERSTARTRSGSEGTSDRALESVRIRLLGGFEVSVGSRTIENGTERRPGTSSGPTREG